MPKPYIPNDKWSQRAAKEGYRARSVYKLMELDERFGLIKEGMIIVDLGAAPGSWLQYAAKKTGPSGAVYGFDLQKIKPIVDPERSRGVEENACPEPERGVKTFVMDIGDRFAVEEALRNEGVREADLVLSDIAPNTSGIKDVDQWKSVELAQASLAIAKDILKPNGKCVVKVFRGADFDEFYAGLKFDWQDVKNVDVEATRDRSREVYVIVRKPDTR